MKEQRKFRAEQLWEGTGSSLKLPAFLQLVLQPEKSREGKRKINGPSAQAALERDFLPYREIFRAEP